MNWGAKQIILFCLLGVALPSFPQTHRNNIIPAARLHYGMIHPHAPDLEPYGQSNPFGVELEWNWQLMRREAWNYCFCYPRTGISFFYINFNNPEILGNAYASYLFVEPVFGAEKKLHTSIRFGMGPAYMNNVYDEVDNPENTFYSSHLSFIVLLSGALNYRLNDKMNLRAFANFNHISNGGIKNPNRGINFSTFGVGVDYNLRNIPYTDRKRVDTLDLLPDKWRFDATLFGTGKTDIKGHEHYAVFGASSKVSRVIGRLYALAGGMEFTIDLADKNEIGRLAEKGEMETVDHKYFAALLGPELLIGRFNFNILCGAYIYSPFERMDQVYQRYTLTFDLTDDFFFGLSIKAHRHVADYLDFRVGYSF